MRYPKKKYKMLKRTSRRYAVYTSNVGNFAPSPCGREQGEGLNRDFRFTLKRHDDEPELFNLNPCPR